MKLDNLEYLAKLTEDDLWELPESQLIELILVMRDYIVNMIMR